jgi:hypothetical protein
MKSQPGDRWISMVPACRVKVPGYAGNSKGSWNLPRHGVFLPANSPVSGI